MCTNEENNTTTTAKTPKKNQTIFKTIQSREVKTYEQVLNFVLPEIVECI